MQQPGEVVYLPSGFLHATYNIDVSASGIAVAVGAQQAAEDVRNTMLRIAKDTLKVNENDVDSLMFVAYQGVTKRKKTIEILRRARDAAPSDVRSYLGLASLFMQTGKTKKAAKVIQSAVKALAKSAQTKPIPRNLYVALLHHLGAQLLSFSEFSAAQKTMRLAHDMDPAASTAIVGLALA